MRKLLFIVPLFTMSLMAQEIHVNHRLNVNKVIKFLKSYSTQDSKGKEKILDFLSSDDSEAIQMNKSLNEVKSEIKDERVADKIQSLARIVNASEVLVEYNYAYQTVPKFQTSLLKDNNSHHIATHFEENNNYLIHTNTTKGTQEVLTLTSAGLLRSVNVSLKLSGNICESDKEIELNLLDQLKWSIGQLQFEQIIESKINSITEQIRDCSVKEEKNENNKKKKDNLRKELEDDFSEIRNDKRVNQA